MTTRLLRSPSIDISSGASNFSPHACTASKIFIFQYSFCGLQLGWFQVITSLKHMGNSAPMTEQRVPSQDLSFTCWRTGKLVLHIIKSYFEDLKTRDTKATPNVQSLYSCAFPGLHYAHTHPMKVDLLYWVCLFKC